MKVIIGVRPLTRLTTLGLIALTLSGHVLADPPKKDEPPTEVTTETVAPGQVADTAKETEATATSLGIELKTRSGSTYTLRGAPEGPDETAVFSGLNQAEQAAFQKNRTLMLKAAAAVLDRTRLPIGFFKTKIAPLFSRAKKEEGEPKEKPTMREAGKETVQQILANLDSELWKNAPVVARTNEIGGSVEVGVAGGAKFGKWGFFGITGIGLTLSVDAKNKVAVLELYQDIEWAKRADPFYAGLGAFGSLLGSAMHHDWKKPIVPEKGSAVCLPGLVGCITSNNLRIGTSKEIGVGFPGIVMINSNIVRVPIARIGVSPNFLGFIKVQTIAGTVLWAAPGALRDAAVWTCQKVMSVFGGGRSPASTK